MKRKLIRTSTKLMSNEDWLNFRDIGLGASDIQTVMHLNPYKSALELFHEKIGTKERPNFGNFRTYMGHEMEPFIAEQWTYWGGCVDTLMYNKTRGLKQRKMRKINAYVQNPDYPHLFVSLDRIINKYDKRGEGALELKTISGWVAKQWADIGVPIGYIIQVLTQMLVCEFKFGELAYLKDFDHFDVLPIEWRQHLINEIIAMTTDFWDKVTEGRILMNQIYVAQQEFNMRKVQELEARIHEIEPVADGSDRLRDFLNDTFNEVKKGLIMGTDEDLRLALKHRSIKETIKDLSSQALEIENLFKQKIRERSGIEFPNKGAIYWTENLNGTRVFRNRVALSA